MWEIPAHITTVWPKLNFLVYRTMERSRHGRPVVHFCAFFGLTHLGYHGCENGALALLGTRIVNDAGLLVILIYI